MTERPARRNAALRDAWFRGAHEILAGEGYGALKLAPLCTRLGVTTGAFYHSFDSWQDFTDALLDDWVRERTEQTVELARRYDDPAERLLVLARASADLLHRTEAAIRVWAGVEDRVAAVQRRVDDSRHAVVLEAMTQLVGERDAQRYATWALSTLVGFEMVADRHAAEDLLWSLHRILETARGGA